VLGPHDGGVCCSARVRNWPDPDLPQSMPYVSYSEQSDLVVLSASSSERAPKRILRAHSGAFAVIAWRCWFPYPLLGSLIGTGLMIAA
jgi:hypothetical protein